MAALPLRPAGTALVIRALVLVLGAGALGLAMNAVRKGGVPLTAFAAPASCGEEEGPPSEIEPADAIRLCGHPEIVIADTRPANRYAEGHVAGAVHLPCDAAGSVASDAMHHLANATTVIVYGESTDDARPVAASLRRRLHHKISVLKGGFQAWNQAGLACASGPCDECKQ
jgi:rhodanese-related sulfurtransferase